MQIRIVQMQLLHREKQLKTLEWHKILNREFREIKKKKHWRFRNFLKASMTETDVYSILHGV